MLGNSTTLNCSDVGLADDCPVTCNLCPELQSDQTQPSSSSSGNSLTADSASNKQFDHWLYYAFVIIIVGALGSVCVGMFFAFMTASYKTYEKRPELGAGEYNA